jgi:hypothetical protein
VSVVCACNGDASASDAVAAHARCRILIGYSSFDLNHKGLQGGAVDALCFDFGFDTMLARSLAAKRAAGAWWCMV